MTTRRRLWSLLNLMFLICFLLWICTFEGGAEILGGMGFYVIAALMFVGLLRIASILYGIPGDRERARTIESRNE
jgi:hypothetical protein